MTRLGVHGRLTFLVLGQFRPFEMPRLRVPPFLSKLLQQHPLAHQLRDRSPCPLVEAPQKPSQRRKEIYGQDSHYTYCYLKIPETPRTASEYD